jgi:cell division transport system ATP-binding protein
VLIADEPTGNLDENYATEIMGIFDAFRQVGVSVIIATHNLHDTGDARVLRLNQGQLLKAEEGALI